jgi:hypothetical protein
VGGRESDSLYRSLYYKRFTPYSARRSLWLYHTRWALSILLRIVRYREKRGQYTFHVFFLLQPAKVLCAYSVDGWTSSFFIWRRTSQLCINSWKLNEEEETQKQKTMSNRVHTLRQETTRWWRCRQLTIFLNFCEHLPNYTASHRHRHENHEFQRLFPLCRIWGSHSGRSSGI